MSPCLSYIEYGTTHDNYFNFYYTLFLLNEKRRISSKMEQFYNAN